MNLQVVVLLFFIYSFLGWCCEVAYGALILGKFVNRGFLNGPICPIYGFGFLGCMWIVTPVMDNLILLFLGTMLLAVSLELVAGYLLEKFFDTKWWDYSDEKFNFKGYICLRFALIWGFAGTFVLRLVHPVILKMVTAISGILAIVLASVFTLALIVDLIASVVTIYKFRKRLEILDKLAGELHEFSDNIGEHISDVTLSVKSESIEVQKRYGIYTDMVRCHLAEEKELYNQHRAEEKAVLNELLREDKAELMIKKDELIKRLSEKKLFQNRIVKAFPTMKIKQYAKGLHALKEALGIQDKDNK